LLAHATGVAVVHAPLPLQVVAAVDLPTAQLAGVHCTVLSGNVQAVGLVPLHAPTQAAVPPHFVRLPRGAPVTVTQWPRLLLSPQLWH
jgi:hypothetical protein